MSDGGRLRWPSFLAGLLVVLILIPAPKVRGEEDSGPPASRLVFAPWKGEFLNRRSQGACCWLADAEGNLRLEVLLGRGGLDQLLDWDGPDGWTIIVAASGDGTMSGWFEEWRPVDPALLGWVRFLPAVLDPDAAWHGPAGVTALGRGAPPCVPSRGPFANLPTMRSYQLTAGPGKQDRRRSLVARGLGRGAEGSVVRVWHPESPAAGTIVTSSRHAGRLIIMPRETYRVTFDAAAFLPWWPLRRVVSFP
ncbi:hypothetical protein CSA17_05865 [bacterium DOLJORAL78_65_58]|nr:MAG: hypothetical protein CSB20_09425 [bacterium DOLZORAL124_64_63]PIE75743.1 MAG: hypothetical protein CSA17_05865 [bacterium DOLJORAL78_65_58]